MATPKIKLYRLPTGYDQSNDKDVQSAFNDQLLPVKLKNVMPNQAYTLVGVSQKNEEILIPVVHIDGSVSDSISNTATEDLVQLENVTGSNYYKIPSTVFGKKIDKFLVCNKTQLQPYFFYLGTNDLGSTVRYYFSKKEYTYVQNVDEYISNINVPQLDENLKFVYGFRQNIGSEGQWVILPIGDRLSTTSGIYVCNLYKYCLNQCVQKIVIQDNANTKGRSFVYDLTRSNLCQSSSKFPTQFIPIVSDSFPKHLMPKICYHSSMINENSSDSSQSDSTLSSFNMVLTKDNGNFQLTKDYKLSNVQSGNQQLNTAVNDVYNKRAILSYYTIPKNIFKNPIQGVFDQTLNRFLSGSENSSDSSQSDSTLSSFNSVFQIYYNKANVYEYQNGVLLKTEYTTSFNTNNVLSIDGVYNTTNDNIISCYIGDDGVLYSDRQYNYKLDLEQDKYYVVQNNYYKWNPIIGYYKTSQQYFNFKSSQGNAVKYYYSAHSQKIYNGTSQSAKPNTLFLQYLQHTDSANLKFQISQDKNTQTTIFDYYGQLKQKLSNKTIKQQYENSLYQYLTSPLVKEKLNKRNNNYVIGLSRGIFDINGSHRPTQSSAPTIQYRGHKSNCQGQYKLDVKKGLFDLTDYINNANNTVFDYFCCNYYYQDSPAYLFVSDYQCWVTQHLRNNPDVFYGKKDYSGDDYLDLNGNSIPTGAIPCFLQNGDGYTVQYRNGAIMFTNKRQDLNFTQGVQSNDGVRIDNATGIVYGGIARANFAYYARLQNVVQQKLDYDSDYSGGGYKYRALKDKKFPDSIGKRWITRDNLSQFMSLSFTTKQKDSTGKLVDVNLPDLKLADRQSLKKFGFQIGEQANQPTRNQLNYNIYTNSFSYPHAYKINNIGKIQRETDNRGSVKVSYKYLTRLSERQLLNRYSTLLNQSFTEQQLYNSFKLVENNSEFCKNNIYFKSLDGQQLDHITVDFHIDEVLKSIIGIKTTVPVMTDGVKLYNKNATTVVKIQKDDQAQYPFVKIQKVGQTQYKDKFKFYIKAKNFRTYNSDSVYSFSLSDQFKTLQIGQSCIVKINNVQTVITKDSFGNAIQYEKVFQYYGSNDSTIQNSKQYICVQLKLFADKNDYKVQQLTQKYVNDDNEVLDKNYYVVSQLQKSFVGQIFIKFYKTITMNRGYFNYSQKMTNSFVQGFETIYAQSESSNSSESVSTIDVNYYNVGKYYKQYRTDDQVVFVISNLLQNTYFSLKVVDIYNISNDRIQTVSYSVKKIQSL